MPQSLSCFSKFIVALCRGAFRLGATFSERVLLFTSIFLPFAAILDTPVVAWWLLGASFVGGLVIWLKNAYFQDQPITDDNPETHERPLQTLGLFLIGFLFLFGATAVVVTFSQANRAKPITTYQVESDRLETPTPLALSAMSYDVQKPVGLSRHRSSPNDETFFYTHVLTFFRAFLACCVLIWLLVKWANARRL